MTTPALLVGAALLALPWGVRGRWRWGRHRFVRMIGRLLVLFGLTAALALIVLGRVEASRVFPPEFLGAQRWLGAWTGLGAPVRLDLPWLVAGMVGGGVIAGLVARVRRRAPMTLGDVSAVMPRTARELGWGAVLSVVAGLCEELYFRLAVPLVLVLAGLGAPAAFALSAALFGWALRYQGGWGIAATAVVAGLLSTAYLLTGQLWVAMVLHAALDVNGLVVRPVLAGLNRSTRQAAG